MKRALGACVVAGVAAMSMIEPTVRADPPTRQTVCHRDGRGRVNEIVVASEAAERGHRQHGDGPPQAYFADSDGDGFGAGDATVTCVQPARTVAVGGDCDAAAAGVHPGAEEVCGNRVDDDCDGAVDETCPAPPPPASHEVQILLHCDPSSEVMATYGVGTHTLPWPVSRNISFVHFVGGTEGRVTLHHCDGRSVAITADSNLCSMDGGCCDAGRWNDTICRITVE